MTDLSINQPSLYRSFVDARFEPRKEKLETVALLDFTHQLVSVEVSAN